jgi:hypothetical protein
MFETLGAFNLLDEEAAALILEKYIRTEAIWDEMRQETDYDDLH